MKDQLSDRVRRHLEEAAVWGSEQSDAFLRLCLEEGYDEDRIVLLARQHAPTVETYESNLDGRVVKRLDGLREQQPEVWQSSSAFLDWNIAYVGVDAAPDWLVPGLIERAESVALVGPAKVGKSLFALEIAASAAVGCNFLGAELEQLSVQYLDLENAPRIVVQRLQAMGFRHDQLGQLHYASLPQLGSLDTPAGADKVLKMVESTSAQLVVIDTLQRALAGDEFSSEPIRNMYRHLILPLKAMGTAVLRLDHTGKDESRGARGSSAKNDDIDQAWQMARKGESLRLHRTHTRTGHGISSYLLVRRTDPLRHEVQESGDAFSFEEGEPLASADDSSVKDLVETLDELGLDRDAGRPTAAAFLKAKGVGYKTEHLAEAVRIRKAGPV